MMNKAILGSLLVVSLAATGCKQTAQAPAGNAAEAPADVEASKDAVKQVESDWLAAYQAKDAAKLASFYAADAVFATPGRTVKGSDAIRKAEDEDMKDPAFKLDFTNERTDVAASGDMAYTSGSYKVTYTVSTTKKVENGTGTYVTVFRKQTDGSWKAVADIATPAEG